MQLTAAIVDETNETWLSRLNSPASPALAEYEARRCAVCGGRDPSFGFGPPLTIKGGDLWACGTHRREVDGQLRARRYFAPEKSLATERDFPNCDITRAGRPAGDGSGADHPDHGDDRQISLF